LVAAAVAAIRRSVAFSEQGLPIDVRAAPDVRWAERGHRSAPHRDGERGAGLGLPQDGADVVAELALGNRPGSHCYGS
jgi:hypothetical protein